MCSGRDVRLRDRVFPSVSCALRLILLLCLALIEILSTETDFTVTLSTRMPALSSSVLKLSNPLNLPLFSINHQFASLVLHSTVSAYRQRMGIIFLYTFNAWHRVWYQVLVEGTENIVGILSSHTKLIVKGILRLYLVQQAYFANSETEVERYKQIAQGLAPEMTKS